LAAGLLLSAVASSFTYAVFTVRMQTDLGGVDILLRDDVAPLTVANFIGYVNSGAYDGTFIDLNFPGFFVQGGGYIYTPPAPFFGGGASHIPEPTSVVNEAMEPGALKNVRGTLAMDRDVGLPDSATTEWFFNVVDNPVFDPPNDPDGYTVFGEVQGDGMDVIDSINAQDICSDLPGVGGLCGDFSNTTLVGASESNEFNPERLMLVSSIGTDSDGDGIIDRVEDAAPIDDDSNDDGTADRDQGHVATFATSKGDYVTVTVPQATSQLQSMDVLGSVFEYANAPVSFCELIGVDFTHNFIGLDVAGLDVDDSVQVTILLDAGATPDSYYNFGPTPTNPDPHWYKFMFDGETGAKIVGNEVTLYFVDGKRGDGDLVPDNDFIETTGGPAVLFDASIIDEDGVADGIEDGAPNGGDGNDDGILDSIQGNVVSFTDLNGDYLTIETGSGVPVRLVDNDFRELPVPGSGVLDGKNLSHGFFSFELCAGTATTAKIILPEGETPSSYIMFGPTPSDPDPHYYNFSFDGETGAEFDGNVITLNFVDGKRGDADLDGTNNEISDPGAPAFPAVNTLAAGGGGGGGGCSLGGADRNPATAGAWWLLISLILMSGIRKVRRH